MQIIKETEEKVDRKQECSKCGAELEQKKGMKCECGHIVTKREEILYELNSKRTKMQAGKKLGLGAQFGFGTLGVLLGMIVFDGILKIHSSYLFLLLAIITYYPGFYVNEKNDERDTVWLIYITMTIITTIETIRWG